MSFSFENYERNLNLIKMGMGEPNAIKTGTTICGLVFKDGVILGADTRSTGGSIVATKTCRKIHYIADHILCCGAGTAADTEKVTEMVSSQVELHRLLTGKKVPVVAASRMIRQHLYQYQGHIGAALIVGGFDLNGPYLCSIAPHGSGEKAQFTAMGSGCLAALSHLERGWKPNLELEEAKKLVRDAINGGVLHDLGSGSNIDLCILTKDGHKLMIPYEIGQKRLPKEKSYVFKPKSTPIISRTVIPIKIANTIVRQMDVEPMEE